MTNEPSPPLPRFEEALRRAEQIVHELEDADLGLDDSLARYEEGVKLLRHCHELLRGAERRIELLSGVDAEGNPVCQPLDDQSSLALEESGQRRSRRRSAPPSPSG